MRFTGVYWLKELIPPSMMEAFESPRLCGNFFYFIFLFIFMIILLFDCFTDRTILAMFSQVVRFFPKPFANTAAASFCCIFVHTSTGKIYKNKFLSRKFCYNDFKENSTSYKNIHITCKLLLCAHPVCMGLHISCNFEIWIFYI